MKLVLCSEGLYTEEIVAKTEELVGKPRNEINVAVINEAYAMYHNNTLKWVLKNLNKVRESFNGKLELVNLLALNQDQVKERINGADIIFVVGGDTEYLMSVYNKTGFTEMLPEFLQTKVYVGSSAGSMIMGKRLSHKTYAKIFQEYENFGIDKYCEYVDVAIMPHLDSPHFPHRKENLVEIAKGHSEDIIYGLRDDSAIIVDGKKQYTIGSKPLILNE